MRSWTFLLLSSALATALAGCAAAPASSDGTASDADGMSLLTRSALDDGHYASEDGKTMLFLASSGMTQHASLFVDGEIVDTDVDVSVMNGMRLLYTDGNLDCANTLHWISTGSPGTTMDSSCDDDEVALFLDNEGVLGAHTSTVTPAAKINVSAATSTSITVDVATASSAAASGITATWTAANEARGTAGTCGTIAIAFVDHDHANAYWVDATPTDATCPKLPLYPTSK